MKSFKYSNYILFGLTLALSPIAANADTATATVPTQLAIRLDELGYLSYPATALTEEDYAAISMDDHFDEPLTEEALFLPDADFAPNDTLSAPPPLDAEKLTLEEARAKFIPNTAYELEADNATMRFRFIDFVDDSARFVPLTPFDAATLHGVFGGCIDCRTVPGIIVIDETNYAVRLSVSPVELDEDGLPQTCYIYCSGSVQRLNGIEGIVE